MQAPQITSKRCIMSQISEENYKDFYKLVKTETITNNLSEFCNIFHSTEDVRKIIKSFSYLWNKGISCLWGIYLNKQLIGFIGLLDLPFHATVFYGLQKNFRSLGIMTECLGTLCKYLQFNIRIHSLYSRVLCDNKASIKVLEKNGFIKVEDCEPNILLRKSF